MKIKRPIFSLILSAIFPGFGQLYNGQVIKGLLYISIKLVINLLRKEPFELLVNEFKAGKDSFDNDIVFIVFSYTVAELVLWVYSMVDAKKNAELLNEKRSEQNKD
jgi:hypothetical protein